MRIPRTRTWWRRRREAPRAAQAPATQHRTPPAPSSPPTARGTVYMSRAARNIPPLDDTRIRLFLTRGQECLYQVNREQPNSAAQPGRTEVAP